MIGFFLDFFIILHEMNQNICGDMFALLSTCEFKYAWWPPFWPPDIKKFVLKHDDPRAAPCDIAINPALNLWGVKWGDEVTTGFGGIHFGIETGGKDEAEEVGSEGSDDVNDEMELIFPVDQQNTIIR